MPKPDDLYASAVLLWPRTLAERNPSLSTIPLLLETQERFTSLLDIADSSPDAWKIALEASSIMTANLFLKHLMVLTDVSSGLLQRLMPSLRSAFTDSTMTYVWSGATHRYVLKSVLSTTRLTNRVLAVDGRGLMHAHVLTDLIEDVAMLLLHGGACKDAGVPAHLQARCVVGQLIGKPRDLTTFMKQRYILMSRVT